MTDYTTQKNTSELVDWCEEMASKWDKAMLDSQDNSSQFAKNVLANIAMFQACANALRIVSDIKFAVDCLEAPEETEEYLKGFEACREIINDMFEPWPQPPEQLKDEG